MKTLKLALMTLALVAPGMSQAQERRVQIATPANFMRLTLDQMDASSIYYTDLIMPYATWKARYPGEHELLNLYPGYDEPTVTVVKSGMSRQDREVLQTYMTKIKALVAKPANQIDVKRFLNERTMLNVLTELATDNIKVKMKTIGVDQLMGNTVPKAVASKTPVANFQWCNEGGTQYVTRPAREVDVSHTMRPNRMWCSNRERSLCVESCFLLTGGLVGNALVPVNLAMPEDSKKDPSMAFQAEVAYYVSEAELGLKTPLARITGVDAPVASIVEINMFYMNQIFQYGKLVAVLQPHNGQTIVSVFFVVNIKKRTWDGFGGAVASFLKGQDRVFNSRKGFTAGLPVFTQDLAKGVVTVLENAN